MNTQQIKEEIHSFINYADERFLRLVHSMVESERNETAFFNTNSNEMIERAEASLKSVETGDSRSIHDFKKDVESWKENRTIQ